MSNGLYVTPLVPKRFADMLPNPNEKDVTGDEAIAYVHWSAKGDVWDMNDICWDWFATGYDPDTGAYHGLACGFDCEPGSWTIEQFENVNELFGADIIDLDTSWVPMSLVAVREMYYPVLRG